MTIRRHMQLVYLIILVSFIAIMVQTVIQIHHVKDTANTVKIRNQLAHSTLEIKACALATIQLDPSKYETAQIFAESEKCISENQQSINASDTRRYTREIANQIDMLWLEYDGKSQALIALAKIDPKSADAQILPTYLNSFIPLKNKIESLVAEIAKDTSRTQAAMTAILDQAENWLIVSLLIIAAVLIGLLIIHNRQVMAKLGAEPYLVANLAAEFARGDLRSDIQLAQGDHNSLLFHMQILKNTMQQVAQRAEAIGNGDLDRHIQIRSEHDRLGKAINRMTLLLQKNSREQSERRWIENGQLQLAAALNGNYSIQQLGDLAVSSVGRYLSAGRGVIYLSNPQDSSLDLAGRFMMTQELTQASRFQVGEGAIGQVAKSKTAIILNHAVGELAPIVTGTSQTNSLTTYTYPLIHDSVLIGVMELASTTPFTPLQITFLESVTTMLASYLTVAQQREDIRQLRMPSSD